MTRHRSILHLVLLLPLLVSALPQQARSAPAAHSAPLAPSTTLVISEVLYDSTSTEPDHEWIEIANVGCAAINLASYKLGDQVTPGGNEGMMRFPAGSVIAPGQAIIVANVATAFYADYGFYPNFEMRNSTALVPDMVHYPTWANGSIALRNAGDDVLLLDANNQVVDGVSWGDSSSFFAFPVVAAGRSMERWPADRDSDTATEWREQGTPTPGRVSFDRVFSAADCGPGSLRLHLLNARPGDTIAFDPAVFPAGNPQTIALTSALALSTANVTVTASGAGVILSGSQAPPGTTGLVISAPNAVIRGLRIQGFDSGISVTAAATHTQVISNVIAFNSAYGVRVAACNGATVTQNAIHDNGLSGIETPCLDAPQLVGLTIGASEVISGTTLPNARVELFSTPTTQGQVYEGFTTADSSGVFTFTRPGGFVGPNVTATATDADGNTSDFSTPRRLTWTILLYLNGDNDLEEAMRDILTHTVPSPRANVLALVDGYTTTAAFSPTVLYDLSDGIPLPITATWLLTGELDMGDPQTLIDFVTWGRAHYPSRHILLSIVDHGGGWAPGGNETPSGSMAAHKRRWSAGNSGLSWDFSDGYDYLDSQEIRDAFAAITGGGSEPLDVVYFDVCLMGMLEVAYQIHGYADYWVSSQNIGWAPKGPDDRYVRLVQSIGPATTPRQLAQDLVQHYASSLPPDGHPFTLAAVDMDALPLVVSATDELALAISATLTTSQQAALLHAVYSATQKIDYDSDLDIEPLSDGFVDLYDLALNAARRYTEPSIISAAHAVTAALSSAVIAEAHASGPPWMAWDEEWNMEGIEWHLDDVHGLSIFFPLGEDLELPIEVTETISISPTVVISRNLRLRETYTCDQLRFACDTAWPALIDAYYAVATAVPTDTTAGPVDGLLPPDITPPQTTVAFSGTVGLGQTVTVTWTSTDTQSGVLSAALWHRPYHGPWTPVAAEVVGASGLFTFTISQRCLQHLAVRASDRCGNVEPPGSALNTVEIDIQPCGLAYLPLVRRNK